MVLGIDVDPDHPTENARAFQKRHQLTYPILVDPTGDSMNAYRLLGTPFNVLIDRAGHVQYLDTGFNPAGLDRILRELLPQETR